jgi:hypothetical protein
VGRTKKYALHFSGKVQDCVLLAKKKKKPSTIHPNGSNAAAKPIQSDPFPEIMFAGFSSLQQQQPQS